MHIRIKFLQSTAEDRESDLKVERVTLPLDNRCPQGAKLMRERFSWKETGAGTTYSKKKVRGMQTRRKWEKTCRGGKKRRQPRDVFLTLDLMDNWSSMCLACLSACACSMWIGTWVSVHAGDYQSVCVSGWMLAWLVLWAYRTACVLTLRINAYSFHSAAGGLEKSNEPERGPESTLSFCLSSTCQQIRGHL